MISLAFLPLDQVAAKNVSKYASLMVAVSGNLQGERSLESEAKDPALQNREGGWGRGSSEIRKFSFFFLGCFCFQQPFLPFIHC